MPIFILPIIFFGIFALFVIIAIISTSISGKGMMKRTTKLMNDFGLEKDFFIKEKRCDYCGAKLEENNKCPSCGAEKKD